MIKIESDYLALEIDDSTAGLTLKDKRSESIWITPGCAFNLQVYDNSLQDYRWYSSKAFNIKQCKYGDNPISTCAITFERISHCKAIARIDFINLNLGFQAVYEIQDERLFLTIPDSGWNLQGENTNEVICLDCMSLFGGGRKGDEGYLVLPHFGGCIRKFNERRERKVSATKAAETDPSSSLGHFLAGNEPDIDGPQTYAAMVYGYQPQWRDLIAYPLWGTIKGNSGWCAYVPFGFGDCDTAIVTSANIGMEKTIAAHPRLIYRHHSHDRRVIEERKIIYTFVNSSALSFADFGRLYRGYLLREGGIRPLKEKRKSSPQTDYLGDAYVFNPLLALKRYYYLNNPNRDGKGILDVYMTCDEVERELSRMKSSGLEKALVTVVGFNTEGHDGLYPTIFPVEREIGGEEGFRSLLNTIDNIGYKSSVHVNIRSNCKSSPDFNPEHVIRDRDGGSLLYEGSGPGGDCYGACPKVSGELFVKHNFHILRDFNLTGGLYTDFMLGVLFRCYHPLHPLTRREYLDAVQSYLDKCVKNFGAAKMESAIAPILDRLDMVLRINNFEISDCLMHGSEMAMRGLADETIPLQAIIFHGIVMHCVDNSCLGQKDYWAHLLRDVSLCAKPRDELRGSQPQWDDFHLFQYRTLCEKLGWLQNEFIEDIHIEGDICNTIFSDGSVVTVNFGRDAVIINDKKVPGRAFAVQPGKANEKDYFIVEEDVKLTNRLPAICPDGSIWPDNQPREGVFMEAGAPTSSFGIMIGKDFA
jgi:hypothetical protein